MSPSPSGHRCSQCLLPGVSEYFTPLTLDTNTGVVSDEDTTEIWETVKEVVIEKVRRNKNRNRKMKKIILLEFKRTTDYSEEYYRDMRRVTDQQHTLILTGLRTLPADRGWEVEVDPLVAGQRSVKEKE